MPPSTDYASELNLRQVAFKNATDRNLVQKTERERQLGFVAGDSSQYTGDPLSVAGQQFQQEADAARDARSAQTIQSGGIGSGGLFRQASAQVRKGADLGRLGLQESFALNEAQYNQANFEEKLSFDADKAQIEIDERLRQEFMDAETDEEAADPAVPAGEVTFNFRGKQKTFTSKKQLIKFLKNRGKKPAEWIKNHPEAARQLGFKVPGHNQQTDGRQAVAGGPTTGRPINTYDATRSVSGKRLTAAQIARFKKKNPGQTRFK